MSYKSHDSCSSHRWRIVVGGSRWEHRWRIGVGALVGALMGALVGGLVGALVTGGGFCGDLVVGASRLEHRWRIGWWRGGSSLRLWHVSISGGYRSIGIGGSCGAGTGRGCGEGIGDRWGLR